MTRIFLGYFYLVMCFSYTTASSRATQKKVKKITDQLLRLDSENRRLLSNPAMTFARDITTSIQQNNASISILCCLLKQYQPDQFGSLSSSTIIRMLQKQPINN